MKRLTYKEVKHFIEVEANTGCKLLSTEYKNAKTKLDIQCKCGAIWNVTFDGFKSSKTRSCPSCSNKRPMKESTKKIMSKISMLDENEVIQLVESINCEYIGRYVRKKTRSTIVKFICPEHGVQEVYWTNLQKRKSCPECSEQNKQNSRLSKKVERYLKKHNINFIKEYKFKQCRYKRPLPFDFYLPQYNICIEVQGRQHYEKAYFGGWSDDVAEEKLQYTKRNDNIKKTFCKTNNILLIEIPYWTDNNDKDFLSILDFYLNKTTRTEVTM